MLALILLLAAVPTAPKTFGPKPSVTDSLLGVLTRLIAHPVQKGKGEFETTQEYENRKTAALKGFGREYAFVASGIKPTYDADKEEAAFLFSVEGFGGSRIIFERTSSVTGSYMGTNAFGVSKKITKISIRRYGIVVSENSPMQFTKSRFADQVAMRFGMDRQAAKMYLPHLRLLFTGRITDPSLNIDDSYDGATIDDPYDRTIHTIPLPFAVLKVEALDPRRDEVWATWTAADKEK